MRLQNPERAKVTLTVAETTAVLEAAGLRTNSNAPASTPVPWAVKQLAGRRTSDSVAAAATRGRRVAADRQRTARGAPVRNRIGRQPSTGSNSRLPDSSRPGDLRPT